MKKNRREGLIPAVVYGAGKDPKTFWVSFKDIERAFHKARSTNVLFELGKDTVLLKEIQKDLISDTPLHIDFLRIKLTEKVEVDVPLRLTGESKGVKNQGGILEHLLRELKVRTLPTEIPEAISIDVSDLEIGQGLLVKDLKIPQGLEISTDANHIVVNVVAPAKEEAAPAPVEAVAEAQPEVIGKGKKEAAEGASPTSVGGPTKAPAGASPTAKPEPPAKK